MQLLQEGFQPGVHQEGVQELGKLWDELFFVVWVDICKRILKKCSEGRRKAKDTLEQLQEEQGRAGQAEDLGVLTLPRRSSCSDLWAHRNCHRAMLCLSWHRLRACKTRTAVGVRSVLGVCPGLRELSTELIQPLSLVALNNPVFGITTGSGTVTPL